MGDDVGLTGPIDKVEALIVGGGPAGLMAAESLARAGIRVVITEAMPSVGRKFLMAGKSGLNLTHTAKNFVTRYSDRSTAFDAALTDFGPDEVRRWAEELGEELFAGSTGRVFPVAMKASPLLRKWLGRLKGLDVELRTRWRWVGWEDELWVFETPEGTRQLRPNVAALALGGGSWARLGSNGQWLDVLRSAGVTCRGFEPSNAGFLVNWSHHMAPHFGSPVKAVMLRAGKVTSRGEWVVTKRGIEGSGVYELTRAVRKGEAVTLDVAPDLTPDEISARISNVPRKASASNRLRKALRLPPVLQALVMEWARPLPSSPDAMSESLKAIPVPVAGLAPLDEAISTAGGVEWSALNGFELKSRPGTFVAGEMLAWDAPTGGWLLTACLATGRAAGKAAATRLAEMPPG